MAEEVPGRPVGQPPDTAGRDVNEANEQLFARLYADLRRLADRELSRQPGVSVSPTTLVHETYLNVIGRDGVSFADRARFLGYIARAMRGLLIDFVRRQKALKRGAGFHITQLTTRVGEKITGGEDLDRLSEALDELAAHDARLAEVVDLKYFCGFSFAEIAGLHGTSERTVQRNWEKARLLLYKQIDAADSCSKT